MIKIFESGKYYRYIGKGKVRKKYPYGKSMVYDGKPHECISVENFDTFQAGLLFLGQKCNTEYGDFQYSKQVFEEVNLVLYALNKIEEKINEV